MKKIIYLLLFTVLSLGVSYSPAYSFGNLPDGWFDGKPVTPPDIKPDPPPVVPPPAVEPTDYSKDFAHMNPCSWKDDGGPGCNGMTLISCPDIPKYDSVVFMADDGRVIPCPTYIPDRGRQQWSNYRWQGKAETRLPGYFLAKRGAQSWKFRMEKPNGTYADNTGKCYRQYR